VGLLLLWLLWQIEGELHEESVLDGGGPGGAAGEDHGDLPVRRAAGGAGGRAASSGRHLINVAVQLQLLVPMKTDEGAGRCGSGTGALKADSIFCVSHVMGFWWCVHDDVCLCISWRGICQWQWSTLTEALLVQCCCRYGSVIFFNMRAKERDMWLNKLQAFVKAPAAPGSQGQAMPASSSSSSSSSSSGFSRPAAPQSARREDGEGHLP